MLEVGVQNWALVAEVDRMVHRMVAFPQVPQPVQVPLLSLHFEVVATLATIILQASYSLSHVGWLKTASCQQSI
jgi:hypothetical protein